jgi:hypothetical protein
MDTGLVNSNRKLGENGSNTKLWRYICEYKNTKKIKVKNFDMTEFRFAEHPLGEYKWFDRQADRSVPVDGYYKERIRYTHEEFKAQVDVENPFPPSPSPQEILEVVIKRERELEIKLLYATDNGLLAFDEKECFRHHVYEFNGIFIYI